MPTQDSLGMGTRITVVNDDNDNKTNEEDENGSRKPVPGSSTPSHMVVHGLGTPPSEARMLGRGGNAGFDIAQWLEIWDYPGGARFRGFTVDGPAQGEKTMFVFFDESVISKDLKHGYVDPFPPLTQLTHIGKTNTSQTASWHS